MNKFIKYANVVFKTLGAGHQEFIYHNAMKVELAKAGISFDSEHNIQINYKGSNVGLKRLDLVIFNSFEDDKKIDTIIELKSITREPRLPEVCQLKHYLKNTGAKKGIIINFPQPPITKKAEEPTEVSYVIVELDNSKDPDDPKE